MKELNLIFPGEPKAIQSVRFRNAGTFIHKYQPKANTDWKAYIRLSAQSQLPPDWSIIESPVELNANFIYSPPKSWPKWKHEAMNFGDDIHKSTRPDLCDNLMKGLCDALTGIVWRDDAQISVLFSQKLYGINPRIELNIVELRI